MNKLLMEKVNIKPASDPADMNTAALVGSRVKLDKGNRLSVTLHMGDSTGATVIFYLKQHNAASAGTSKELAVINPYYHKVGAATVFTKVEPTVALDEFDVSTLFAADPGVLTLEVLAEDLDVNNGFYWASVEAADSAAAKLVSPLYMVHESYNCPAYEAAL